jgi:hypothetical protein
MTVRFFKGIRTCFTQMGSVHCATEPKPIIRTLPPNPSFTHLRLGFVLSPDTASRPSIRRHNADEVQGIKDFIWSNGKKWPATSDR